MNTATIEPVRSGVPGITIADADQDYTRPPIMLHTPMVVLMHVFMKARMLAVPRPAGSTAESEILQNPGLMRQVDAGMSALGNGTFFDKLIPDSEVRGKRKRGPELDS